MKDLLDRVKAATGPDRELDVRIETWLMGGVSDETTLGLIGVLHSGWTPSADEFPHYTSSIDAALALVEKKLPGCVYTIANMHEGVRGGRCLIMDLPSPVSSFYEKAGEAHAATLPLAILAALLTALEGGAT